MGFLGFWRCAFLKKIMGLCPWSPLGGLQLPQLFFLSLCVLHWIQGTYISSLVQAYSQILPSPPAWMCPFYFVWTLPFHSRFGPDVKTVFFWEVASRCYRKFHQPSFFPRTAILSSHCYSFLALLFFPRTAILSSHCDSFLALLFFPRTAILSSHCDSWEVHPLIWHSKKCKLG